MFLRVLFPSLVKFVFLRVMVLNIISTTVEAKVTVGLGAYAASSKGSRLCH